MPAMSQESAVEVTERDASLLFVDYDWYAIWSAEELTQQLSTDDCAFTFNGVGCIFLSLLGMVKLIEILC